MSGIIEQFNNHIADLRKENERLRGLLREAVNRLDLAKDALHLEADKCRTLSTRIQEKIDPTPHGKDER